jgi:H+/Cl- antiporter ClcA
MSTLPIRANELPHGWSFPAFARIGAYLSLLGEAYAEAMQMTHEARKKYPFADV